MNELSITEGQSTALALMGNRELTPQIWTMISQMAPVMHKSRLFGVASEEQAIGIMLKGYELGLSITASFELVQVVQGKPGLSPRGAMALLLNSPKIKKIEVNRVLDNNGAYLGHSCRMVRDNGFEYMTKYTIEDAKRAGLVKPGSGWEAYPENMCQWRAIGFCADMVAPDITAGMTNIMKMPEQYGIALTEGGEIFEVSAKDAPAPVVEKVKPKILTLDELVDLYGAQAVMDANNGRIPMSDSEVAAVAENIRKL